MALYWLLHRAVGEAGPGLALVLCFAVFFWSVVSLGGTVLPLGDTPAQALLAISAAFSPIMAQVLGRIWLDGPLLAFTTAGAALFVRGYLRRSTWLLCAAGVVLGYASLIKVTAFFAVPGVLAVGWSVDSSRNWRQLVRPTSLFIGIAAIVQFPWEIWQWRALGSIWSGKPAAALVESNSYVHYITVSRSAWIYVTLLPQVIWTLVPSLILLVVLWRQTTLRRRGLALVVWVAVVVGVAMALGVLGYGKILRYVILVTPATSLLFALAAGSAWRTWRQSPRPAMRTVGALLVVLALAGLGLELAQSLETTFVDNGRVDLIEPLTGPHQ